MNLQPVAAVEQFAARHREGLSVIHRHLADAVPQAFAMVEPLHPDGRVDGGVLSALVRDAFLVALESERMLAGELTGVERPFRSVRFFDSESRPCRVHMHPRNLQTGRYLGTTSAVEPLFGAPETDFEIAVLWRPSLKSKSLRSVCLAAVGNLKTRNHTTIYANAPLPPVDMETYWEPVVSETYHEPADDFEDYLAGEEFGDEFD